MDRLQKDWFGRLQINTHEAQPGNIAIHAWLKGTGCVFFSVPLNLAGTEFFWEEVHERAKQMWLKLKVPQYRKYFCPVCKSALPKFQRRYKDNYFCAWCGSHYKLEGYNIILLRSIIPT
jgi:hypothetical protein